MDNLPRMLRCNEFPQPSDNPPANVDVNGNLHQQPAEQHLSDGNEDSNGNIIQEQIIRPNVRWANDDEVAAVLNNEGIVEMLDQVIQDHPELLLEIPDERPSLDYVNTDGAAESGRAPALSEDDNPMLESNGRGIPPLRQEDSEQRVTNQGEPNVSETLRLSGTFLALSPSHGSILPNVSEHTPSSLAALASTPREQLFPAISPVELHEDDRSSSPALVGLDSSEPTGHDNHQPMSPSSTIPGSSIVTSAEQSALEPTGIPLTCRIAWFTCRCYEIGDLNSLSSYRSRANLLENGRYDELCRHSSPNMIAAINNAFDNLHCKLLDEMEQDILIYCDRLGRLPSLSPWQPAPSSLAPPSHPGLDLKNDLPGASNHKSAASVSSNTSESSAIENNKIPLRTVWDPRAESLMNRWYQRNQNYAYPAPSTYQLIVRATGQSLAKVKKWFSNKRVRENNTKSDAEIVEGRRHRKDLGPEAQKDDDDLLKNDIKDIYNGVDISSEEEEEAEDEQHRG